MEKTIQVLGVGLGVGCLFVTCYVEYADIPFVFKVTGKSNTIHPIPQQSILDDTIGRNSPE